MGRIFEKRKHKMFARYDKMAKTFTRIGKEIAIATKAGGPNPDSNPRLRAAMQNAKSNAMPKDRVEAAIKRAQGKDALDLSEVVYEGYGPHGVAMMIETATDNTTRTVANLRSYFNKLGGALGNAGSVEFMFQRRGVFKINLAGKTMDDLEMDLIDAGAEDIEVDDDEGVATAYTEFENFLKMQKMLEDKKIETTMAEVHRIPSNTVGLTDEQMDDVAKLIDRIEEDDDVQHVFHNIG
jgi:YebC/PmpR family DNA-binding regulatory protein